MKKIRIIFQNNKVKGNVFPEMPNSADYSTESGWLEAHQLYEIAYQKAIDEALPILNPDIIPEDKFSTASFLSNIVDGLVYVDDWLGTFEYGYINTRTKITNGMAEYKKPDCIILRLQEKSINT